MDHPYTSIPGSDADALVKAMVGGTVDRARRIFRYGGFTGSLTVDGPYIGRTDTLAPAAMGGVNDGWVCDARHVTFRGDVELRVCFGDFPALPRTEPPKPEPEDLEWRAAQRTLTTLERRRGHLRDLAGDPNPAIAGAAAGELESGDAEYQAARMTAAKIEGARARRARRDRNATRGCQDCP